MEGARPDLPVRALINPDKTKFDYDNKIISSDFINFSFKSIFNLYTVSFPCVFSNK